MASGGKRGRSVGVMALAISFLGDAPPTEFRIFQAGKNSTLKGEFIFDAQAAAEVMAAYAAHGNDVMIDLEHLSLESPEASRNFDPDARGWCRLELRSGELWAVAVTWTPDGQERLRDKRQRYISPAFGYDEARRITSVLNIAITAMPATDKLQPLVAANAITSEDGPMTPEQFAQIAEALGLGADANVEDVLATIAAMVKKIQDAANGNAEAPAEEPPAETEAPAVAAAPPVVAASKVRAAVRTLARLTSKADLSEMVREVEAWRASHVELESKRASLAKDRETLEASERRRLTGDLVKLGFETPATAWSDDAGTKPAEPWASMPMEQLRARVAKLSKAKGIAPTTEPRPATSQRPSGETAVMVGGKTVMLTASEVAACESAKAKLEDYASNKLIRMRANGETV